jgi:hypothetical protein
MSLYCATGDVKSDLLPQLQDLLAESLAKLGPRNRVLAVPPDQSRIHSRSGDLTRYAWEYYGDRLQTVLPALGTHAAMRPDQIARMFGAMPPLWGNCSGTASHRLPRDCQITVEDILGGLHHEYQLEKCVA